MRLLKLTMAVFFVLAATAVAFADEVKPIAMNNRAIGGASLNAYTPGVQNGAGANNIGILVKTWGKVTWVDTTNQFFYIDDGTALKDGSKHTDTGKDVDNVGVRVSYSNLANGNTIIPPSIGVYVTVIGISSTSIINGNIQPNIRSRSQSDIQ